MQASLIIPCRNEKAFITNCLNSLIAQDYPKVKMEILVIDGMSEDGTREIINDYARRFPLIRMLDNQRKITPCALNIGVKAALGDIIIRMDAHATYSPDYISKCIQHLNESKADNVGGAMVTLARENTFVGQLIVAVLTSKFGVGNSNFRTGAKKPKETDTVFGGCYQKDVFSRIGMFNEKLARTQDMEFNLRLQKHGGRIMLFPDIVSYYYTCSTLRSFCRSNFRNGLWAILPLKYSEVIPISLRHLIPLLFVLCVLASSFPGFFGHRFAWGLAGIITIYLSAALYFSLRAAINRQDWRYPLALPFMFFFLHVLYGLGSLWALLQCLISIDFWKNIIKISRTQKV